MFKVIYDIWRAEHAGEDLRRIPEGFYPESVAYLARLREELQSSQMQPLQRQLLTDQLSQAESMLHEIRRIRIKKIVRAASSGNSTPKDGLTKEEARLYDSTRQAVEEHLQAIQKPPAQPEPEKKVLVRFLQEVPEFVGVDLNSYGPFRAEDVSAIPQENAVQLIKKNYAMEIEESP